MGATIASIIAGVVKLLGVLAEWFGRQQLINAGKAEEAAKRDGAALDVAKKQGDVIAEQRTPEDAATRLDSGDF